ncbi:MAG TPA: nicotinate phosphoribosyltransferase [Actinomycetota bacterium]|nr:nicotinate phosphoribosyltransferase [Actinomycetota bacterium]
MSWVDDRNAALLTDLYELTMAASYHAHGMNEPATFDLFVRKLPERRNFLVACGLEQALSYLETLRFDDDSIAYLRSLEMFDDGFLSFLGDLRFTGDVHAVAEGEIVFDREPLLRVTAPMIEAQIVETFLLNGVTFQTMIASKAARVALAARGRDFVDFSPRRDHAADAAIKAARAAYVGGAAATSNVLAGRLYGIPVNGTMAHSYVMAFEDERTAFRTFARDFPDRAVLLIDTFDVEEGARIAADVARELAAEGSRLRGVRIDSGELGELARAVRKILDYEGLHDVRIVVSGDLDEVRVAGLIDDGAPVDAFGVGTQLGTSADAPTLGGVYKLVSDAHGPKMKFSAGKATLPGRKQVFRTTAGGRLHHDVIALEDEPVDGEPLLHPVMANGRRTAPPEGLDAIRTRCRAGLERLPERLRVLDPATEPYPVTLSPRLDALVAAMERGAS